MDQSSRQAVLVTGGAGYIGSHTCKKLHDSGYHPVIFDNLSSGHRDVSLLVSFIHGNVLDESAILGAFLSSGRRPVTHFANLIEVARSVEPPDLFWEHNVGGTSTPLRVAGDVGVKRIVFSSSAAGDDFPTPDRGGACGRSGDRNVALLARGDEHRHGRGCSVLDVIRAVEAASGRAVPYTVGPRRECDPSGLVADPTRAKNRLAWPQLRRRWQTSSAARSPGT